MTRIACPECGQTVEPADASQPGPGSLRCPSCNATFALDEGTEPGGETAVLQRAKTKRGAMLDIALVGHLRVSGSLSLEAPSALRPGKTVVGREGADIIATDNTLSAQHFEVENRGGDFFVRDLSSTNGTRVNGELLCKTERLRSGDRIEAGQTTFVFRTLETIPWNPSRQQGADHDQTS
jgi:hypothetical protein